VTVWVYINTAKEVGDVDHLKAAKKLPSDGSLSTRRDRAFVIQPWQNAPPSHATSRPVGPARPRHAFDAAGAGKGRSRSKPRRVTPAVTRSGFFLSEI
jgi:hypothetical protein